MPTRTSYLERYRAGEREAVWRELVALGPAVRQEPVYSDARAVARETMTRVRHNVELIVGRLKELDYQFVDPHDVLVAPDAVLLARLDRLEADAGGPLPLALRAFYEVVGSVNLMGAHPKLSSYADSPNLQHMVDAVSEAVAAHPTGPAAKESAAPTDPLAGLPSQLAALLGGAAGGAPAATPGGPMSLLAQAMATARELTRRITEVQEDAARQMTEGGPPSERFVANQQLAETLRVRMHMHTADDPPPAQEGIASDPLVVWAPEDDDIEAYHELGDPDDPDAQDEEGWTGRYVLDISPDACHKANTSGGSPYQVAFPDLNADAPIIDHGAESLVGYLRDCFRWGGFPDLALVADPPAAELARLREGLMEI